MSIWPACLHRSSVDLNGFSVELEGDLDPDGFMGKPQCQKRLFRNTLQDEYRV